MAAAGSLPEVPEADASPALRALYADLRGAIGTAVVPLVYRHIATYPGCLEWSWAVLRPLYAEGHLAAAAERLMEAIRLPALVPLPPPALAAVGIPPADAVTIGRILDVYNRSNPMNLVGLRVLLGALAQPPSAAPSEPRAAAAAAATHAARDLSAVLPPMLEPAQIDADSLALIRELGTVAGNTPSPSLPSVYRQLAHWPGYFPVALALLRGLAACGWIGGAVEAVEARLPAEVQALLDTVRWPDGPRPADAALAAMRSAIERFTERRLLEILPVTRALRAALP